MKTHKKGAGSNEDLERTPPEHHASTPEGRENELIALAYKATEERIKNGTASAQELVHFLRLGSTKERLEKENLEAEMKLKEAKIEALQATDRLEKLYNDAIEAMKRYSGGSDE